MGRLCHSQGVFDKPFGGLHVIFAGDFHQMKCVSGTPIVTHTSSITPANREAFEAKRIWNNHMTHFAELIHNMCERSPLQEILSRR